MAFQWTVQGRPAGSSDSGKWYEMWCAAHCLVLAKASKLKTYSGRKQYVMSAEQDEIKYFNLNFIGVLILFPFNINVMCLQ